MTAENKQQENYGTLSHRSIANALFVTQISGHFIKTLSPRNATEQLVKKLAFCSHIERFNNTMRQRISRLVCSTLSFSKKLENHIDAIWYFIHHYNACLQT